MTLTELSFATKRALLWFVIVVFSFYTLKFVFIKAKSLYLTLNPPKQPPAEASFGNVPQLEFESLSFSEGSFPEYVLDTKTGKLPSFPDRTWVYKLFMPIPRISAEKEAKEFAKSVNFLGSPAKKSLIEFVWNTNGNQRSLYFNIATKEIFLETSSEYLGDNLSLGFVLSPIEAQNKAQSFLQARGLLSEDLQNGEIKTAYIRADSRGFSETANYLQANLVRVDFYRKVKSNEDTENLIYGDSPPKAMVSVYISNPSDYEKRSDISLIYPILYYNNQVLLLDKSAYPLISVEKAWDFVKNGGGNVIYLKKNTEDYYSVYTPLSVAKMEMRDVKLSYFQPQTPTAFLQPIYVFEGVFTTKERESGAFYIYVQAIDPQHISF
ncbi:MAG: hypothetical protein ABIJ36_01000 [Patescibacteria group bacterium]|nr:hypothetical protein [Patescibacteria group bacterium]